VRCLVVAVCALWLAAPAGASQLIDRDVSGLTLKVDGTGRALLGYTAHGQRRHVLVWGAVNARYPDGPAAGRPPQVRFQVDYSGGWKTRHADLWKHFANRCAPYDGPALPFLLAACDAPDGSYWAAQAWQTDLPDLGFLPWTSLQKAWRLQVSHWTGEPAAIEASTDWIHGGRVHNVFGRATYRGHPIFGFGTTNHGVPLDGYGRLIHLDTYDSGYGAGWRRENAFVLKRPNGNFCYGLFKRDPTIGGNVAPPGWQGGLRPMGHGTRYRLILTGPGVTPDVAWYGRDPGAWDPRDPAKVAYQRSQQALARDLAGSDRACG
jgi:hypothetical protein